VEAQLAACGSIVPGLTSVYRWQGAVHKDPELLLVIKTRAALLSALAARVKQLHPYDEPEVLALPAVGGSAGYLRWVLDSTAGAP
jgi:periplasmic divalent cation tolerance protein